MLQPLPNAGTIQIDDTGGIRNVGFNGATISPKDTFNVCYSLVFGVITIFKQFKESENRICLADKIKGTQY